MNQSELATIPTVAELMGKPTVPEQAVPVTMLRVGRDTDFISMARNTAPKLAGVMWNERCITLVAQNRFVIASFEPELTPIATMFMAPHEKRDRDEDIKIWEGEFAPVQFTKQNLLKFLKRVEMVDAPKEVIAAIRDMKVTEKKEISTSINLTETSETTVMEESMDTNLPQRFSLMIPVSDGFVGKFDFEAKVVPAKNKYGDEDKLKKCIELRMTNARQVLSARMESIIAQIPAEVPKYYGRMDVRVGEGRWA